MVSHCDYADDTMVLANSAENLQFQLNRFHEYACHKELTLNTNKAKVMVFFSADSSQLPTFEYNGTALEDVTEFKYLGVLLRRDGKINAATGPMARYFMGGIARVQKAGAELGILNRKHAMLWLCQIFALTAGFLNSLWVVKRATKTHCLLRETGQMPLYFYWFRCIMRFWNSLLSTNNALLSQVAQADLRLADNKGSWTHQVRVRVTVRGLGRQNWAKVGETLLPKVKLGYSDYYSLIGEV
eukprot:1148388-Pelagomonas_calceolata.AAC.1